MDIKRRDGESYIAYAKRITNGKADGTLDIDYVEWGSNLINKEYSSDNFRKAFYVIYELLKNIDEEVEINFTEDDLIKEIEQKKIEFQKEKIKFQDQRTAFNKLIRERARQEELNEIIVQTINSGNLPQLNYTYKEFKPTDNDILASLNDLHFGYETDTYWNKYNSDICRDMLEEYIDKILQVKKIHNSQNCYITSNGDLISGNIHKSITLENKENVIQQIMGVAELVSNFLVELSYHFDNVTFASTVGNHGRLDKKNDALKDENLELLIDWYIKARLQNFKNIKVIEDKIDITMYVLNIRGLNFLNVHGNEDNSNYKIQSAIQMAGVPIVAFCSAHLHHNKTDYVQGVKTLMGGSMIGMDSLCIKSRIIGFAQQLITIVNDDGVLCHYDANFK